MLGYPSIPMVTKMASKTFTSLSIGCFLRSFACAYLWSLRYFALSSRYWLPYLTDCVNKLLYVVSNEETEIINRVSA